MHLVLVASAGNQAYVFASNRLREAVGASYLIAETTTSVVRANLGGGHVVSASSGSALVVVPSEAAARELVLAVSDFVVRTAPGLSVLGVHMPIGTEEPSVEEIAALRRLWGRHAGVAVGVDARWPRLPVVAACGSTDLPASGWFSDGFQVAGRFPAGEQPAPWSQAVAAKRRARWAAHGRMANVLESTDAGADLKLVNTGDLLDGVEWVGVVHADANRLGRVFHGAPEILADLPVSVGDRSLGALSAAVQNCADEAFGVAVAVVAGLAGRTRNLPVVPLVVGGDDLTVLVDGQYAAAFAQHYLLEFGKRAAADPLVSAVAGALTVSAGVAVIKPHFPFSTAYELADQLCRNAKTVAGAHAGCHGLDMHVLLDTTVSGLAALRAGYEVWNGHNWVSATKRPFLLAGSPGTPVPRERDWQWLVEHAELVRRTSTGGQGRVVTRSQLHALRTELRTDPVRASRRVAQWQQRAVAEDDRALAAALAESPAAPVLDLLELAEFAATEVPA